MRSFGFDFFFFVLFFIFMVSFLCLPLGFCIFEVFVAMVALFGVCHRLWVTFSFEVLVFFAPPCSLVYFACFLLLFFLFA